MAPHGGREPDFGLVLANGGSYYIDEGRPVPGAIEATVRNLREVAPTFYFNVPRGFEALLPFLHRDEALRRRFFRRVKLLFFAGAGLSQRVFDEMRELATCLARFDAGATGSSTRVERMLVAEEPLSLDGGEVTDKGTVNQRAVLARRADLVEALYADPPEPEVICASRDS